MEAARPRFEMTAAVAALALAGTAALVLGVADAIGFRSAGAEAVFLAASILGWTLLAWATILGGLGAFQLVHRLVSGRSAAWPDVLLLVAGTAVIVAVISTHPLWGSGSGVG